MGVEIISFQTYVECKKFTIEMAWAAKRSANEPLTGLYGDLLTTQFHLLFLIGPLTRRHQFSKSLSTFIFLLAQVRLKVHKRIGFGRAGLYFWVELPGRLPLLGKRFRAMGGPGCKKVSSCHF